MVYLEGEVLLIKMPIMCDEEATQITPGFRVRAGGRIL
jgi:hypothetical protein